MPKAPPLTYLSWTLYVVGTALVLGSYVKLVPLGLAWAGWAAAMAGWAIGALSRRTRRL